MCYNHSLPWHEGLTCEQYDSMKEHGDPSFGQTEEWINQNTKRCPSCRANIQKGEACFHMTCESEQCTRLETSPIFTSLTTDFGIEQVRNAVSNFAGNV